jgi:hypothetical protein
MKKSLICFAKGGKIRKLETIVESIAKRILLQPFPIELRSSVQAEFGLDHKFSYIQRFICSSGGPNIRECLFLLLKSR